MRSALGEALARFLDLVRIELRLASHLDAVGPLNRAALVRALDDRPRRHYAKAPHRHRAAVFVWLMLLFYPVLKVILRLDEASFGIGCAHCMYDSFEPGKLSGTTRDCSG